MQFNTETDFKQSYTFKHKFLSEFFTLILFSQSKQIRKSNSFISVAYKCKPIYYYISAEHGKSLKYFLLQETAS